MKMKATDFRKKCISEKQEQNQCLEILNGLPNFNVWRQNTGASRYQNKDGTYRMVRFSSKGMPDIMGYVKKDGKTIPFFWEVKRHNGKLSDTQKMFLEKFEEDGCYASYGTSQDLIRYLSIKKLMEWSV